MRAALLMTMVGGLMAAACALPAAGQVQPDRVCTGEGVVLNAAGPRPLARAQVVAATEPVRGAATDSAGHWIIPGLPCGPARFTITHPGFLPGTQAGLNSQTPVMLIAEATITGRVLDEAGDPIPGASVQVFSSAVVAGKREMRRGTAANTNSQGEYRIDALPAGRYVVCATSSRPVFAVGGGSPLQYGASCRPAPPSSGASTASRVESGRELRADLFLTAAPGFHVRGTLTGVPAGARVVVEIVNRDGVNDAQPEQKATIARNNRFDVPRILPGSYLVEAIATADGRNLLAAQEIQVGYADFDGLELDFAPAVAVTGMLRVESPSDDPLPSVRVNLIPSDPGGYASDAEWDPAQKQFVLSNVAPGRYRVNVSQIPPQYYLKSVNLLNRNVLGQELTVTAPASPLEIVLADDGGRLEGTILDADGKPVPGQVFLLNGNRRAISQRSEDGLFAIGNIPPGDYKVYAFDEGRNVEYANPEWMSSYAAGAADLSVGARDSVNISLVRQMVPPE